jgi:L-alanine-DL-glutamate epimerase-like enolase superfamily enzyme
MSKPPSTIPVPPVGPRNPLPKGAFSAFVGRMKLNFRRVELQLAHTWTIARTSGTNTSNVVIVEVEGPGGVRGIGESAPISRYNESPESVEAFLKKIDPARLSFSDVASSMKYLESLSEHDASAKCAVNIALLDGAARQAGVPLYDFLGLGFTENKHVTSFTIGIDKPDVIRKKVIEAERFPVLKMKVGVPDDVANMKALREISPKKEVRVDANEGWKTKEQALEMIQWLKSDGYIQYIEQPLPASTPPKDWVWLKERSPLMIFADESYHSAKDIPMVAECFHGVNVKLVKAGGVSAGFEALSAARKAGLKTMIGCMIESSVLISAAAHLAELCDYLDLDGNILITNDPYQGVTSEKGILSFRSAPEKVGLRVCPRK